MNSFSDHSIHESKETANKLFKKIEKYMDDSDHEYNSKDFDEHTAELYRKMTNELTTIYKLRSRKFAYEYLKAIFDDAMKSSEDRKIESQVRNILKACKSLVSKSNYEINKKEHTIGSYKLNQTEDIGPTNVGVNLNDQRIRFKVKSKT
jgi:hypothetical protein